VRTAECHRHSQHALPNLERLRYLRGYEVLMAGTIRVDPCDGLCRSSEPLGGSTPSESESVARLTTDATHTAGAITPPPTQASPARCAGDTPAATVRFEERRTECRRWVDIPPADVLARLYTRRGWTPIAVSSMIPERG